MYTYRKDKRFLYFHRWTSIIDSNSWTQRN